MNSPATFKYTSLKPAKESLARHWRAMLSLSIEKRPQKSVLARTLHEGPLRVQRPFYPESDGCCHVYLLHPPGGMVIGDELEINAEIKSQANALLTTPSAGKIYGAKESDATQSQKVNLSVDAGACLEWLPQETIVFNSARGKLHTRVNLRGDAKFFGWDIVRLGRVASGEDFTQGSCQQSIEIWRDDCPEFIERNKIVAGNELHKGRWGLADRNSTGTLFATVVLDRNAVDSLYDKLQALTSDTCLWGLSQKEGVFLARYLGNSITHCRKGFELIWRETRVHFNNKNAVVPRIWNT